MKGEQSKARQVLLAEYRAAVCGATRAGVEVFLLRCAIHMKDAASLNELDKAIARAGARVLFRHYGRETFEDAVVAVSEALGASTKISNLLEEEPL